MRLNTKFFLLNLGCAKNLVEGEHIAGMLISMGMKFIEQPQQADWLLVNTCGFLTSAIEENIDYILELAANKQEKQKLVVIGCLVGRYGKKLQASLPEVDIFISPGRVNDLPDILLNPPNSGIAIAPAKTVLGFSTPRAISTGPGWAYLRLSDGCNHKCSFCAIPHIRGKLRSRSKDDILAEASFLAQSGIRELNLVAQDVSAYGNDLGANNGLLELLREMDKIPGLQWIRLLYLYPEVLKKEFLDLLANSEKILPYFDIPLQHVSTRVLKAMGRKQDKAFIIEQLNLLRATLPQAAVRSTMLVGHPGEDEAEFEELYDFIKEYKFEHLGCFAFEPQEGTRSARLPQLAAKIGRQRQKKIMALQKKISQQKGRTMVGRLEKMLFMGAHPESELLGVGRLWHQAPEVDGEAIVVDGRAMPGNIVNVRILKAHDYDYEVEIINND